MTASAPDAGATPSAAVPSAPIVPSPLAACPRGRRHRSRHRGARSYGRFRHPCTSRQLPAPDAPLSSVGVRPRAARRPTPGRLVPLLLAANACAGSTLRSGVGDTILERPPYYAGSRTADTARVGHFPVGYQRGSAQEPIFDPAGESGTPVAALLADMNAYLDSLGVTRRVDARQAPPGTPPDVQFGCVADPIGDCAVDDDANDDAPDTGKPRQRLAVGRPSGEWVAWARPALDSAGVARAVLLTVEVGQYMPRQTNLRGSKVVELGTGYVVPLPWLTSLETPVTVLQLTGALVDRDGRAVRIGAEGLLAQRTRLTVSALGAQRLITAEDVEQLRTSRRDDLPGRPLVWQAALRELVGRLTGATTGTTPRAGAGDL